MDYRASEVITEFVVGVVLTIFIVYGIGYLHGRTTTSKKLRWITKADNGAQGRIIDTWGHDRDKDGWVIVLYGSPPQLVRVAAEDLPLTLSTGDQVMIVDNVVVDPRLPDGKPSIERKWEPPPPRGLMEFD